MSARDRIGGAQEALRKVQAQAAALEELSEQLSLSVHVLEGELAALAAQARSGERETSERTSGKDVGTVETALSVSARSTDMEGARLVALNMALEGEPRDAVQRYLVEHFEIADGERLLDEVYAAVNA